MSSSPSMSPRKRWIASEKIAVGVLEELGYRVIETGRKVVINNVEVGEIDAMATDPSGELYAVEIKAGRVDVSGIRQAYVNSILVGAKPLVVCKGFADDAARELAERLGVKVIQLSDVFLVESEELYTIVREVIEETLVDYLEIFYGYAPQLKTEHYEVLEAIRSTSTIEEAASKLGLDPAGLARRIDELRRQGVIPKWASKYASVKRVAQLLVQKQSVSSALDESRRLLEQLKGVEEQLRSLQLAIQGVNQQLKRLLDLLSRVESRVQVEQKQSST